MSKIYESLNPPQQEAVSCTEGPLLILAGAGSGKTRVLTHRIAYLIEEKGVDPWNILAITFTNKAADEMRERVDRLVGNGCESIWVSTFHSACVRILRRHIDFLGYDNHFVIYDTDDQKSVVKDIVKRFDLDTRVYKEKALMARISQAKDRLLTADDLAKDARDSFEETAARVYREYQSVLVRNNALDFDDLIFRTVELFEKHPQVLDYYQERFKYILVDEYQDTNLAQFRLIGLLAEKYQNLCVVGDDDQSIYRFRGADIRNILQFENVFPDAVVIRLEQNYRSTAQILEAANFVIANNEGRKEKRLWTANEPGEKIRFRQFLNGFEEAEYIVGEIEKARREGEFRYKDCAVLYRTNAQSRLFEEKLLYAGIPYKIVGGINFYARKEIKDLLAYLKTVDNARDDLSVRRILNVPRRGIGDTTQARIQAYAEDMGYSFYEALRVAEEIPSMGRSLKKIEGFVNLIQTLKSKAELFSVRELLEEVIKATGYVEELQAEGTEEAESRIENIDELVSKSQAYMEAAEARGETPTLSAFLEEIALVADIDTVDNTQDYVLLMTLHSAKGLEFPWVFMAGMEEDLFPNVSYQRGGDEEELEEERRLCYVGITRAMKRLTMTSARQRMLRGDIQMHSVSRFVHEIPRDLVDLGYTVEDKNPKLSSVLPSQSPYAKMREAFRAKPYQKTASAPSPRNFGDSGKKDELDYTVGDTVRHAKFGVGKVTEIVKGGRDYEVTVEFDRAGRRKMFAGFAKLQKI